MLYRQTFQILTQYLTNNHTKILGGFEQMTKIKTLQDLMDRVPSISEYFYNFKKTGEGRYNLDKFIPPEFTNWRDEQQSWGDTVGLLHQSHHMSEIYVKGPDAIKFIEKMGVNSMDNFTTERPKQYIACSPSGHIIGDGILHRHAEDEVELIASSAIVNWLKYHAEKGDYDIEVTPDYSSHIDRSGNRRNWRFQLVGPNADPLLEELIGEPLPELRFFRTTVVTIRGCKALVLRHSMTTQGYELSGPFEDEEKVREAILEVGEKYGITPVGTNTYFSNAAGSGWMARPVPGIYTDESLKDYRKWLSADSEEATLEIGGSYFSPNIEDYYVTPYDVDYGRLVSFDHDFIGREALENYPEEKKRVKVPLVWDKEDVQRVMASQFGDGPRYKSIPMPSVNYTFNQFDKILSRHGEFVGVSCHAAYYNPIGEITSICMVDPKVAEPGTEVAIVWGEPNGGSNKPGVEKHVQTIIRATVVDKPVLQRLVK